MSEEKKSDEFIFIKPGESKSEPKTQKFTPDAGTDAVDFIFAKPSKPEDKRKGEGMAEAAGAGAVAGAAARYKGMELSGKTLKPGESVFTPSEKQVEFINAQLRQRTGDPTIDVRGMTQEQVNRLLSGGEGSTLGTTGRQRTETFNLESQRRARNQQEIENLVREAFPGTRDPLAQIGEPMVQTRGNLIVPASAATHQAEREAAQTAQMLTEARQAAGTAGRTAGLTKIGQGTIGGALTGVQAYNMVKQPQPTDWTQWLSLLGNLGITLGGQRTGTLGGLAQIPYAVKHREEIARGMGLGEINPTVFGGAPEALETPIGSAMGNR